MGAACASDRTAPGDKRPVLVVGAGMAGLAAARSLADAKWPVRVGSKVARPPLAMTR
jgi:2-polyprenyl-6-methoxyphenol hydroxylase-like FAD-dependent oxidoreductase